MTADVARVKVRLQECANPPVRASTQHSGRKHISDVTAEQYCEKARSQTPSQQVEQSENGDELMLFQQQTDAKNKDAVTSTYTPDPAAERADEQGRGHNDDYATDEINQNGTVTQHN